MSKLTVRPASSPACPSVVKPTLFGLGGLVAATALALAATACTVDAEEGLGEDGAAAKLPGDTVDCFPGCKQADFDKLTKVGDKGKYDLAKACKNLLDGWSKPAKGTPPAMDWPGWDPKKPICIGHKDSIKDRKDCNRLVDAPGWTECKNELMMACAKDKQPGWGPIILVPPKGGFPKPRNPPSITDQELACIKQWKCDVKNSDALPKSAGGVRIKSAVPVCVEESCGCDGSWVVEEQPPTDEVEVTPEPVAVDALPVETDYRFAP